MHVIQKTVKELLGSAELPVVAPGDPVAAAVRSMKRTGAAAVLVMESGRLVGIFTERDLVCRVAAQGLPESTLLSLVMTRDPVTLRPGDCVTWAINRLASHRFSNLPIVEENGQIVGLLGVRDVLDHLSEVFAELEGPEESNADNAEWIDVGGGA